MKGREIRDVRHSALNKSMYARYNNVNLLGKTLSRNVFH